MASNDDLLGPYLIDGRHTHERSLGAVCPGCNEVHHFRIEKDETLPTNTPLWTFDGNAAAPTFRASMLVRTYRYPANATPEDDAEFDQAHAKGAEAMFAHPKFGVRCHSFVSHGHWQFLQDCTHALRDQTVPMVDVAAWRAKREARRSSALSASLAANTPALKPAPGAALPMKNGQWRAV